ncbi:MAG: alpha/beta fold hydrolase [Candidatus Lokiarchaeota archaeon]|nr:alpha/beta fold hydrolase [Candidatus Lokiarchaeota archaeon]
MSLFQNHSWINRKNLLIVCIGLFMVGFILSLVGTYTPSENTPVRVRITTYQKYTDELNSYFNRTVSGAAEDAENKLIENYNINGYIILPKSEKPTNGYPVLIWMHGFGACSDFQLNYPRQFAKSGFIAVAIDQPGHGSSGGYWDMGIQTILGVYSTIEWLINESSYKEIIDKDRIGVSGHSMGGVAATQAGLFDNRTNPQTGNLIGTSKIDSVCAVYCWNNLGVIAEDLMETVLGIEDIWYHSVIQELLKNWRWLANGDPTTVMDEVFIRSPDNFINIMNMTNYCMIVGEYDEMINIEAACHLMANSTIDTSGSPQITYDHIYDEIWENTNHTWDFGSYEAYNYRRMVLIPNVKHIFEGFSLRVVQNMTYWFNDSMDCSNVIPQVNKGFQALFLVKLAGWFLILIGSLLGIFPTFSYIISYMKNYDKSHISKENIKENSIEEKRIKVDRYSQSNMNFISNQQILKRYLPLLIGFYTLAGIISVPSMTHFWIFDLLLPRFLISSILSIFILIIFQILTNLGTVEVNYINFNRSIMTSGFSYLQYLIPLISLLIWIVPFALIGWFIGIPFILPRPLTIETYLDVLLLFIILFFFNLSIDLIFRNNIQRNIKNDKSMGGKNLELKRIIKSGIYSGISIGVAMGLQFVVMFGPLFKEALHMIPLLILAFCCLFIILGLISAYTFEKTGNYIISSLFVSLLMTLLISGRLFLNYA